MPSMMAEGLRRSHTYLGKLELLLDIRHRSLTLEADERSRDQLRVDGVCADYLTTDTQESTHLGRGELTYPACT